MSLLDPRLAGGIAAIRGRFHAEGQAEQRQAVNALMDQYAKLTMSEEEYIAYQVRHGQLTQQQAEWQTAIVRETARQKDEQEGVAAALQRAAEFAQSFLQDAEKGFDAIVRAAEEADRGAEALTASVRTPGERLAEELAGIRAVADLITPVTRARAELQALLKAQGAGVDLAVLGYKEFGISGKSTRAAQAQSTRTASSFYASDVTGMAVGSGPALLTAAQETAQNTADIKTSIVKILQFT
jgi:hypothetical protein